MSKHTENEIVQVTMIREPRSDKWTEWEGKVGSVVTVVEKCGIVLYEIEDSQHNTAWFWEDELEKRIEELEFVEGQTVGIKDPTYWRGNLRGVIARVVISTGSQLYLVEDDVGRRELFWSRELYKI